MTLSIQPGQFIILMIKEKGERIPVTVADFDREIGLIRIVFQMAGKTSEELSTLEEGDELFSFIGPLGRKTEIESYGKVISYFLRSFFDTIKNKITKSSRYRIQDPISYHLDNSIPEIFANHSSYLTIKLRKTREILS